MARVYNWDVKRKQSEKASSSWTLSSLSCSCTFVAKEIVENFKFLFKYAFQAFNLWPLQNVFHCCTVLLILRQLSVGFACFSVSWCALCFQWVCDKITSWNQFQLTACLPFFVQLRRLSYCLGPTGEKNEKAVLLIAFFLFAAFYFFKIMTDCC